MWLKKKVSKKVNEQPDKTKTEKIIFANKIVITRNTNRKKCGGTGIYKKPACIRDYNNK